MIKITDIKGTSSDICFIVNDISYYKGSGELLQNGFCVYEESLCFVNNETSHKINKQDIDELKAAVVSLTSDSDFRVTFA